MRVRVNQTVWKTINLLLHSRARPEERWGDVLNVALHSVRTLLHRHQWDSSWTNVSISAEIDVWPHNAYLAPTRRFGVVASSCSQHKWPTLCWSITAGGTPFVCARKVFQRTRRHRVDVGSCSMSWHWDRTKHASCFNTRRWERRDKLRCETTDRAWYSNTSIGAPCSTFMCGTTTSTCCSASPKVLDVEKVQWSVTQEQCYCDCYITSLYLELYNLCYEPWSQKCIK